MSPPATTFTPPQAALAIAALAEAQGAVAADPACQALLDGAAGPVMLLDGSSRQLLAVNQDLAALLPPEDRAGLIGRRPGDLLGCQFAGDQRDSCGQSWGCWHCQLAGGISALERGDSQRIQGEGRLSIHRGGGIATIDIAYTGLRLAVAGRLVVAMSLRDLGAAHRVELMERLFFHDLINLAGSIHGLAEAIAEPGERDHEYERMVDLLRWSSRQLVDEMRFHRSVRAAEEGTLHCDWRAIDVSRLISRVIEVYAGRSPGTPRIEVRDAGDGLHLRSDPVLLTRILGNFVRNAVEATEAGGLVWISASAQAEGLRFAVGNPGVMPPAVQAAVFTRSFSTKASQGRGLGTYSARLLGERFLGGHVSFVSDAEHGTVFRLDLPLEPPPEVAHA